MFGWVRSFIQFVNDENRRDIEKSLRALLDNQGSKPRCPKCRGRRLNTEIRRAGRDNGAVMDFFGHPPPDRTPGQILRYLQQPRVREDIGRCGGRRLRGRRDATPGRD